MLWHPTAVLACCCCFCCCNTGCLCTSHRQSCSCTHSLLFLPTCFKTKIHTTSRQPCHVPQDQDPHYFPAAMPCPSSSCTCHFRLTLSACTPCQQRIGKAEAGVYCTQGPVQREQQRAAAGHVYSACARTRCSTEPSRSSPHLGGESPPAVAMN